VLRPMRRGHQQTAANRNATSATQAATNSQT
jgi:hypothetical protein